MNLSHRFNGFDQFSKLLRELPQNVENKIVQGAVTAAMREGRKAVRAAAPVYMDKQSLASKLYGTTKKNIRVVRLKRVQRGQKGARIDTGNAFWSLFYQLGTRYQPARPWFDVAFRAAQGSIVKVLIDQIGAGIEKEASKYRGGR